MNASFPFFSNESGAAGMGVYHTHPRCRVAQSIIADHQVAGMGDNRHECPFCFLLGQFQGNRSGSASRLPDPTGPAGAHRGGPAPVPQSAYRR